MITIVHIIADANFSGVPRHVLALATGLKKSFKVIVIGPIGPAESEFKRHNVDYRVVTMGSKFDRGAIAEIRSQIKTTGADKLIIHCHGVRAGLLGRLAVRTFDFPVLYSEHSWTKDYHLPNRLNEFIQLSVLRYLDQFTTKTVGVSQAVVDFLLHARITGSNKVVRIYNGIELPKKTVSPSQDPVIGSIGSLTWQKNYRFMVELMPEIIKEIPEAKLEIVGEGPEKDMLRIKIESLALKNNVTIKEPIEHSRLPESYKNWMLYVQPSVNEAFGLAAAEAMAAGLPVLGANVGSMPEIIGTKNGLFDLTHKEKTVSKIVEFLKNSQKRAKLRDIQLKHVRQFSVEKMLNSYRQVYIELLKKT